MTFKDAIKKDVNNVFINPLEFADEHYINGEAVYCVIDKDIEAEAAAKFEGVFRNSITVYIASELGIKPVEGELIDIDDRHYIVVSISDEYGVYIINAELNDQ